MRRQEEGRGEKSKDEKMLFRHKYTFLIISYYHPST